MRGEILFIVDNDVASLEISTNQNFSPSTQTLHPCKLLFITGEYGSYMDTWGFSASTTVGID